MGEATRVKQKTRAKETEMNFQKYRNGKCMADVAEKHGMNDIRIVERESRV